MMRSISSEHFAAIDLCSSRVPAFLPAAWDSAKAEDAAVDVDAGKVVEAAAAARARAAVVVVAAAAVAPGRHAKGGR